MAININEIINPPKPIVERPDDNIADALMRDYGWNPLDPDPRNPRLTMDQEGVISLENWDEKLFGKKPKIDDLRKSKKEII